MISFFDLPAIDAFARQLRIDPQAIRRARVAFFKKGQSVDDAIGHFSKDVRDRLTEEVSFGLAEQPRSFDSVVDGASKLVYRTDEGYSFESVILRPSTGRIALCVSSQVGCAAACAFCATGRMGVAKDLATHDILHQVAEANRRLHTEGRRVRNIVFMGMGEPLHNEAAVQSALEVLQSPQAFDHSPGRILVSTVGVPGPLLRTAKRFPRTNFALSLHSARQSVRERIIPLAKRFVLGELRDTVRLLNEIQPAKTAVMIEYLLLDGVNDGAEDAEALLDWLTGLRVHVNLIPFNPIEGASELVASPRETIEWFGGLLRSAGYPTTIRYSLGRDIEAACGQLVRQENRALAARLSAGKAS